MYASRRAVAPAVNNFEDAEVWEIKPSVEI